MAKQNKIAVRSEQKKQESGTGELWPLQWIVRAHAEKEGGIALPLPEELKFFAPTTVLFHMTIPPAHLYRFVPPVCNNLNSEKTNSLQASCQAMKVFVKISKIKCKYHSLFH